jgi:nitrite reductase (NADH) small subunit
MSERGGRLDEDDCGGRLQTALWIPVTRVDNIPPREGRAVSLAGREIAIFNLGPSTTLGEGPSTALGVNDQFLAVDNQCPHKAGPLADGIVTGTSVVCPLHTWKISLLDGRVERPSGSGEHGVTAYPTRVEDGVVVVGLPAVAAGAAKQSLNIQNCLTEERILRERLANPPCPSPGGCVSSNPGGPVV